jgi:hypothetical protein
MFEQFIEKKYIDTLRPFAMIDYGKVDIITPEKILVECESKIKIYQSSSEYNLETNNQRINEIILEYNKNTYFYLKYNNVSNNYILKVITESPHQKYDTIRRINEIIKTIKNGNNS